MAQAGRKSLLEALAEGPTACSLVNLLEISLFSKTFWGGLRGNSQRAILGILGAG